MAKRWQGRGDAGSALRRQWLELRFLAGARRARSVGDVLAHVRAHGFDASIRTIQRDLQDLKASFPLKTVGSQPQGWLFDRAAPRTLIPGLSSHEALTFLLVEQQLGPLLPTEARAHLEGHFREARAALAAEEGGTAAAWSRRVCAAPRAQPLLPARICPGVTEAVYDAVLHSRQLEVQYRNRGGEVRTYALHPLGLAVRDTTTYLVATVGEFESPVLFLLHRMRTAKVLEASARTPRGFDVRDYVDREVQFPMGEGPIPLVLRIQEDVLPSFEETPLSVDQTITAAGKGAFLVRASVRDTRTLRAFLLGYGAMAEVLEPRELRQALAAETATMAAAYRRRSRSRK